MSERRSVRKRVSESLQVTDLMTGAALGRIGNLSVDGLMLISPRALAERHVYQVQFPLPGAAAGAPRMDVGIQCLWSEAASGDHSHWTGCQIISISPDGQEMLDDWVARSAEGG
ncbi:MAG TPA: PilZ domain-containing protein [Xanthomonadales bacterium]|nr:PilZ domain-containing protein [Xanthomonadales bacterium]